MAEGVLLLGAISNLNKLLKKKVYWAAFELYYFIFG